MTNSRTSSSGEYNEKKKKRMKKKDKDGKFVIWKQGENEKP